jgi:hypothetical protein
LIVKSKFDCGKAYLSGLKEKYGFRTQINLILRARDSEQQNLTYGGENFEIEVF